MTDNFEIIDPPVTPHSSVGEIKAWIIELKNKKLTDAVNEAIEQASNWLEWKKDE